MILLTLLLIPSLIALVSFIFGKGRVTAREFILQLIAQTIVISIGFWIVFQSDTADKEIWNGRVSQKQRLEVGCRHSYTCNCITVSCGKDCSTTICQTCYEHSYDVDWPLTTTNGEAIYIDTIDRQGLFEPPRWTKAQLGDTTSLQHSYKNYIKAAPGSLFNKKGQKEKYLKELPNYPGNIYDYHYLDRLVNIGTPVNYSVWNKAIAELNADIGKSKQANLIVVLTYNKTEDFYYALEQHWIGGKKNDIILVANTPDGKSINRVQVMAWTTNEIFKINMRDSILNLKTLDHELVLATAKAVILKDFIRRPMEDFKYLERAVVPTFGQYLFLFIFGFLVSSGITYFVNVNYIEE